jgi:hypothetical protein
VLVGVDLKRLTILPILPKPESRAPRHHALSLPVFSPIIGTFGYAKQIAKIANQSAAIGNLGNGKTNCQSCPNCQWSDPTTPIDHAPSTRCQAHTVMPIRSVIVLFARSLFAVGFLLAKPPPRADGLAGQGRWVHKKFFYF